MQKYLKMLEQNVQWIALGLGGIYLLWMAYAYVLTPPVVVQLGNGPADKKVTPDEVDRVIYDQAGKPLETAMSRNDPVEIKVADVLAPFAAKIEEKDIQLADLAAPWSGSRGTLLEDNGNVGQNNGARIAKLPVEPKAQFVAESHDVTTVAKPDANGALPIPVVNGNAPAAEALPPHTDTPWISTKWKIPAQALQQAWAAAFNNPNVPGFQALFFTKVLHVDLMRQEMMPDGKWGDETQVEQMTPDMPKYPGATVPTDDRNARQNGFAYRQWAGTAQKLILEPRFPDVLSFTHPWYAPGQPKPDMKKRGQGNMANPRPRPIVAPPINRAPPQPWMNQPAPPPGQGGAVQAGAGDIDVSKVTTDIEILCHDITVLPGHKYRYRLKYELANPTWDSANIAGKDLTNQFAIVSEPSDWSSEIEAPETGYMYVVNVSTQSNRATVDVFEWKDAKWVQTKVNASPGDAVKDFTVVDIRRDAARNGESYMLIMDRNGNIVRKDKNQDSHDPKYDELKNAIAAEQPNVGRGMQALAR